MRMKAFTVERAGSDGTNGVSVEHRNLTPLSWALAIKVLIPSISLCADPPPPPRSLIGLSENITHLTLGCESTSRSNRLTAFLTPEQLENLHVHYVKTIREVLELALPTTDSEEQRDAEEREKVLAEQEQTVV
jgi:hypothetical protein